MERREEWERQSRVYEEEKMRLKDFVFQTTTRKMRI